MTRGVAFFAASAGGTSGVTWNPADKSAKVVLSGANLVAARLQDTTQSYASVRAVSAKAAGKWYFEVLVAAGGTPLYTMIGVGNATAPITGFVGSDTNGWGYYADTGGKYSNGAETAYGAPFINGDTIGVAVDFTAGKVWFSKNGTFQASGNPAAGTGQAFSGLTGSLFPMVSLYNGNRATDFVTGRFKASALTYTPPTGFSSWE